MLLALVLGAVTTTPVTGATCDPEGTDATAVVAARAAIDAACPCASAENRNAYRACARDVIRTRVGSGMLPASCRREAFRHAKLSICGRPGAVVCCRVRANGRTRHGIAANASRCVSAVSTTACVSTWQSVPVGCDATGCIPPTTTTTTTITSTTSATTSTTASTTTTITTTTTVPNPGCGNGVIDPGEECDPPDTLRCDETCHAITCEPTGLCGNGTVDPGEACEPPGVDACGRDCQLAPCAPPQASEVGVACIGALTPLGVGATSAGYLVAWSARQQHDIYDLLVRRYDADGVAVDAAATVASDGAPCPLGHFEPSVTSDGTLYYAVWMGSGPIFSEFTYQAMYGRRFPTGGGEGALDELTTHVPFGTCGYFLSGPTMAAGIATSRVAVGWHGTSYCYPPGPLVTDPIGAIVALGPPPVQTPVPLGFGLEMPPTSLSSSPASVGSTASDTLWVWQSFYAATIDPPYTPFVAAVWTDAGGSTAPFILSARGASTGGRPGVAAGASSFLVTWRQGATDTATTQTEIRGLRATRVSGNIDPDGGVVLATAPSGITAGPVVAYDGARWLVVWAETSGSGNDLRAVAVEEDGTVVDASPRLVASDVAALDPAAASAGDGRVLVVFARPDGTSTAVRATLVTP
jgi:hypothetical protein